MRLRIRAHKGLGGGIVLEGNNMKLGPGGIREIEFFTQTRQIIAGGRDRALRVRGTEEGLARIPRSIREGSLALGATKAETLWRIVLPMASPALMTGMILAVARAAGEVAPLMLVGVVKLAPSLPLDMNAPFLHLDRKFMHLGFHIYDVGFQSPNVEAARPLVYATALLLVVVIVALNLTAIWIRNNLREKYKALD